MAEPEHRVAHRGGALGRVRPGTGGTVAGRSGLPPDGGETLLAVMTRRTAGRLCRRDDQVVITAAESYPPNDRLVITA